MKKLTALLLALTMILLCGMTACTTGIGDNGGKGAVTTGSTVDDAPYIEAGKELRTLLGAAELVLCDVMNAFPQDAAAETGKACFTASIDLGELLAGDPSVELPTDVTVYLDGLNYRLVAKSALLGEYGELLTLGRDADGHYLISSPLLYERPLRMTEAEYILLTESLLGGILGGSELYEDNDWVYKDPAYLVDEDPDYWVDEDYDDNLELVPELMAASTLLEQVKIYVAANAETVRAALTEMGQTILLLVGNNMTFTVPKNSETVPFTVGDSTVSCFKINASLSAKQAVTAITAFKNYLAGENAMRTLLAELPTRAPDLATALADLGVPCDQLMDLIVTEMEGALAESGDEEMLAAAGQVEAEFYLSAKDGSLVALNATVPDGDSFVPVSIVLGENVTTSPEVKIEIGSGDDRMGIRMTRTVTEDSTVVVLTFTEHNVDEGVLSLTVKDGSFEFGIVGYGEDGEDGVSGRLTGVFGKDEAGKYTCVIEKLHMVQGEWIQDVNLNLTLTAQFGVEMPAVENVKEYSELTEEDLEAIGLALETLLQMFGVGGM